MTTETNDQPEPIIWFEGTLISSPRQNRSAEDWLLETMAMGTATRKITIHASGREHSENIRDHARKGSRLMVKGTAGDEGSGIDIEATSLAFDPSHDEPDGNRRHGPPPPRAIRPDKAGDGEWIDINGHVGRLMSTLMADGRPFSIDVTPGGMTTVTPLPPPKDAEAAGGDAQAETEPADGRITSRKTLYDRFRARLKENLAERKQ